MKKSNVVWGCLLILLGVVFGLNALEIASINIFFKGWWTLFIIIPSLVGLLEDRDKKSNFIFLIVGIILLLASRGIIDFALVGKLIVPLILVMIGLLLVFKREDKDFKSFVVNDKEEVCVTFSEQKVSIDDEITNRKASAIFGKLTLDLSNAKIKKETNIRVEAVFGSVEVLLPQGVDLKVKATPIFGSVNNTYNGTGNKTVYIIADAIFGGVTIK